MPNPKKRRDIKKRGFTRKDHKNCISRESKNMKKRNVFAHRSKRKNNRSIHKIKYKPLSCDALQKNLTLKRCKEVTKNRHRKRTKPKVVQGVMPVEVLENKAIHKYWYKRYRLFSKYDEGIKLDEESWYSVTPEEIAISIARRCQSNVIIDAFCGAGGNTIQFALTCDKVIAIDIDPAKIDLARHNARIYGVEDKIEFIVGDFTKLAPTLQADGVFLSPPWGGMDYNKTNSYDLNQICPPLGCASLYKLSAQITQNIIMYLPRNINKTQLKELAGPGVDVRLEQNTFGPNKIVAITAYFSELPFSQPQCRILTVSQLEKTSSGITMNSHFGYVPC